jgi:hypothetical protein
VLFLQNKQSNLSSIMVSKEGLGCLFIEKLFLIKWSVKALKRALFWNLILKIFFFVFVCSYSIALEISTYGPKFNASLLCAE